MLVISCFDDFCLIKCKPWIDYICLYIVGVRIGVVVCEVWMKTKNYELSMKNELDDDFDMNWCYDSMFIVVLIAFWCMLTNRHVWDQNQGFDGKLDGFLRGNPRTGCTCLVQLDGWVVARRGKLLSAVTHVFGVPGVLGPVQTFLNDSFDVFNCCYAF